MKIRRFFGKDMREALNAVKAELGSDAVIMSNRKVADGIELVAAYDKDPDAKMSFKTRHPQQREGATPASGKTVPSLSEIIGDDGPDSLRALLEKQAETQSAYKHESQPEHNFKANAAPVSQVSAPEPVTPKHAYQFDNHFDEAPEPASVFDDPTPAQHRSGTGDLDAIKEELASLRSVLQYQVADLMEARQRRQRPIHSYLTQCLIGMGISSHLAEQLVNYTPADYNERDAWIYLLNLLANRLNVTGNDILSQTGVVALVGPTGTGKTTTVAKLAARYAQKYGAEQVAMITIDTYRIAAFEQLATYGKIIGCTVRKAQTSEELAEQLFQLRHKRLILVDTAGFSQRDSRLIKQLNQFNHGQMQPVRKYLVAQANTQYPALQRIIGAYDAVKLDGCIFTKLDECYSLGEILSVAVEYQLPVSYVTDGQQVPEDIKVADAKSLVSAAAKLYKKYGLNHTKDNHVVNSARAV
ncbi:flagellar biosynthesis protein FlhF [Alteromonas pelagimontana]|uniref:Flagellar biosynthesis protein FlhF n=1 Tax=Alteromonas pelagimontana TaxID=1858656 RepID=A0A6M4MG77_9ALTE|nr:flagellar biosynthesis protein FlhF [Alteromonas pelagimontana]QJR81868.1 flagellar biosynthesis protein FlhF [Alteromonas pelagimontana]